MWYVHMPQLLCQLKPQTPTPLGVFFQSLQSVTATATKFIPMVYHDITRREAPNISFTAVNAPVEETYVRQMAYSTCLHRDCETPFAAVSLPFTPNIADNKARKLIFHQHPSCGCASNPFTACCGCGSWLSSLSVCLRTSQSCFPEKLAANHIEPKIC